MPQASQLGVACQPRRLPQHFQLGLVSELLTALGRALVLGHPQLAPSLATGTTLMAGTTLTFRMLLQNRLESLW